MKKILFYCQYHLGMGHLVRSVEILRSLATEFEICFVKGGTDVEGLDLPENIQVVTLPVLLSEHRQLQVADPSQDLETVKQQRTITLLNIFDEFQPDCLIIEGYPFKKYQFDLNNETVENLLNDSNGILLFNEAKGLLISPDEKTLIEKFKPLQEISYSKVAKQYTIYKLEEALEKGIALI